MLNALWVMVAFWAVVALWWWARFGLSIRYAFDDWEWLAKGTRPWSLFKEQLSFRTEVFRPVFQDLYAVSVGLWGLSPLPMAVVVMASHLAGVYATARLTRALGAGVWAGVLLGVMVLFDAVSVASMAYVSLNQVVLARALMLLALAVLLEEPTRKGRWLSLVVLAMATHEQAVLLLPLWWVCVVIRDGWGEKDWVLKRVEARWLGGVVLGYVALRWVLRESDPGLPHALGLGAVFEKTKLFLSQARDFVGGLMGVAGANTSERWVGDGKQLVKFWGLGVFWCGVFLLWVALEGSRALRWILGGALWALVGYAPYFFAVNETAKYHFNVALVGLAMPFAVAVTRVFVGFRERGRAWSEVGAVGVVVLTAVAVLPMGSARFMRSEVDVLSRVLTVVRSRVRPGREGEWRVLFVDDVSRREWNGSTEYFEAMGGGWDVNQVAPHDGKMWGLWLSLRGEYPRVWLLTGEHLNYVCLREGDVALRVTPAVGGDPLEVGFEAEPECERGDGLPLALDERSEVGRKLTEALGPRAVLLPRARDYWRAYRAQDRETAMRVGREILEARGRRRGEGGLRRGVGGLDVVDGFFDGIEATMPVLGRSERWVQ